jgi:hypothetical protein
VVVPNLPGGTATYTEGNYSRAGIVNYTLDPDMSKWEDPIKLYVSVREQYIPTSKTDFYFLLAPSVQPPRFKKDNVTVSAGPLLAWPTPVHAVDVDETIKMGADYLMTISCPISTETATVVATLPGGTATWNKSSDGTTDTLTFQLEASKKSDWESPIKIYLSLGYTNAPSIK